MRTVWCGHNEQITWNGQQRTENIEAVCKKTVKLLEFHHVEQTSSTPYALHIYAFLIICDLLRGLVVYGGLKD